MNQHFNLTRFTHLLRLTLMVEKQRALLTLLVSLGIALFLFLLAHSYENEVTRDRLFYLHHYFFLISLFFGSYLFTGSSFPALRKSPTDVRYLTLPASTLEKVLAYGLLCGLLYPGTYLVVYWLYAYLINAVAGTVYPAFYRSFALEPEVTQWLLVLILTQPIFLFGAVAFRKLPVIQTFLYTSGLVAALVLSLLLYFQGLDVTVDFFRQAIYTTPYWLGGLALLFSLLSYHRLTTKTA